MATAASIGISAIINALAFSGSSFLFSKLNHAGYEAEMKRHNLAQEQLSRAKEKWYENEIKKKDDIQRLRQELSDVNSDINETNKALEILSRIRTIQYNGRTFRKEPELSDFYRPSDKMKEYQYVAIGALGIVSGYLIHWGFKD